MEACIPTAEAEEKVFVALPEDFKAGRSTLSWALGYFRDSGAKIVITHVHVPPQMIPVMGVKFHASKLSTEQVNLFRLIEREKVNKRLDEYIYQCLKRKVKSEKLVFEKEDVATGLVELIALHGISKLVIAAAADRHHSKKMEKPKSTTAMEVMQKADPSCKIWFVCKEQLICTRHNLRDSRFLVNNEQRRSNSNEYKDDEFKVAPEVTSLLPEFDSDILNLSPRHGKDGIGLDLGFYNELQEACKAAEDLMKRTLGEYSKRQKADEEVVYYFQKAKEYEDLYFNEVQQRKEIEGVLARAKEEVGQLKQAMDILKNQQDETFEKLQDAVAEKLVLEQRTIDIDDDLATARRNLLNSQQLKYAELQRDHNNVVREVEALCSERKLTESSPSPSSVILSPFDEECVPPYFMCPIFQEAMRDPCIAADGFTYEADAIRGWLSSGHETSPVTNLPLAHYELIPNHTLRSVIQDHLARQQYRLP